MARILVGGFQHETNTFAPSKADLAAFESPGGWPAMVTGPDLFEAVAGINLPIAGFCQEMEARGHTLIPSTWGAASPSAEVTEDAYETIAGKIVDAITAAEGLDAVYLCLHGAMVAEHLEDGEGELLGRVRSVIGPDLPLVASLDLHANVTPEMVDHADALIAFRTYPHVDMAYTGLRVARHLDETLSGNGMPWRAFRQLDFLIPLVWQCTMAEPAAGLYKLLAEVEMETGAVLSFTPGFPAADIHHCGPAVFGMADDETVAQIAVDRIADAIEAAESEFAGSLFEPAAAVREAMRLSEGKSRPIVIADTQDNPGAGGDSDTTGMLRALVEEGAEGAAIGVMVDAAAAEAAHQAGEGAEITLGLGGKSGIPGDAPFKETFRVESLSDGTLTATGPFYSGARMRLGPSARLSINGVEIVVASRKVQMADQEMYRFVGIAPEKKRILVNKSSVHFRADFAPIAEEILIATAPGPMIADPAQLDWRRLRSGMRLSPNGPAKIE